MGKFVSNVILSIGYEHIPERKKPCICVMRGNECSVLGTFKNDADAEFFIDALAEFVGLRKVGDE